MTKTVAQSISSTLDARQDTYGSFEDVATTSQNLQAVIADAVGDKEVSAVQQEALQAICSKLARLANGDINYIDSWHDIAGYATLVVNDLTAKLPTRAAKRR
jgi:hypothetical protein